jgi:hemerythrin superfamily protein
MPTRTQSKSAQASGNVAADAIAALMADHKRVKALFEEFEEMKEEGDEEDKDDLVRQICGELTVHATLEEEIFYPAVRKAIDDADLMDEATVEHACAKELIAQLEEMEVGDDLYDAKVTVLGEQIEHHVKEEEGEMFAQARKAKVDMAALGKKMEKRRAELVAELGLDEDEDGDEEDGSDDEEEDDAKSKR